MMTTTKKRKLTKGEIIRNRMIFALLTIIIISVVLIGLVHIGENFEKFSPVSAYHLTLDAERGIESAEEKLDWYVDKDVALNDRFIVIYKFSEKYGWDPYEIEKLYKESGYTSFQKFLDKELLS